MVHKHNSTRLHYDLRLEIGGVLASWAIPKGPSYEPAVKRLAVQTEDHPFEYGKFEGRIPDGEYGAGDSLIWDRGTFASVPPGEESAQRIKGRMHIRLNGEKLKGEWHLVRTRTAKDSGKPQWLCIKAHDGKENPNFDVVAERPESVKSGRRTARGPVTQRVLKSPHPNPIDLLVKVWPPMLATLSNTHKAPASSFVYKVKYDGFRALAALAGGKLALQTRNALDLTARFPEVAKALCQIKIGEAVLDGEIVSYDGKKVSRFSRLAEGKGAARYVAFDLLWLDGNDLRSEKLEDRRELLESLLDNDPSLIDLAERLDDPESAERALSHAKKKGWEGLIAKRKERPYSPGRSTDWLKLKLSRAQEFAIIGYTEISNGKPEIGALHLAV